MGAHRTIYSCLHCFLITESLNGWIFIDYYRRSKNLGYEQWRLLVQLEGRFRVGREHWIFGWTAWQRIYIVRRGGHPCSNQYLYHRCLRRCSHWQFETGPLRGQETRRIADEVLAKDQPTRDQGQTAQDPRAVIRIRRIRGGKAILNTIDFSHCK